MGKVWGSVRPKEDVLTSIYDNIVKTFTPANYSLQKLGQRSRVAYRKIPVIKESVEIIRTHFTDAAITKMVVGKMYTSSVEKKREV